MVLDQGCIKEFDTPANLLQDRSSMFHKMAKDAGILGQYIDVGARTDWYKFWNIMALSTWE